MPFAKALPEERRTRDLVPALDDAMLIAQLDNRSQDACDLHDKMILKLNCKSKSILRILMDR